MRPPNVSLVAILSVFVLLSCLLGSVTGLARQQLPGGRRLVRRHNFVKAHQPAGDATAHGYGPPLPYYTDEPDVPTDLTSYSSLKEPTATEAPTESSRAGMSSGSDVSSRNGTVSSDSSSFPISSGLETDTAMISADSSAKAGSTTSSEVPSTTHLTVSTSSSVTETARDGATGISESQLPTTWNNTSSLSSPRASAGTDIASISASLNSTASFKTKTELPSTSISSAIVSDVVTGTVTVTESITLTDIASSLQASEVASATDRVSSGVETESFSSAAASTSFLGSSIAIESTTTSTKALNFTVTVSVAESTGSVVTLSSVTYLTQMNGSSSPSTSSDHSSELSSALSISSDQTATTTIIPAQNSSRISTKGLTAVTTEDRPTSDSLVASVGETITTQSALTETSTAELTQSSRASNSSVNGTASVTSTTYLTSILSGITTDSTHSFDSPRSTVIVSDGSTGVGTEESTATVISRTVTASIAVTTSKKLTGSSFTSFATNSSALSVSGSTLSGSIWESTSGTATTSAQTSSETLFASSALPVNTTSQTGTISFTVTTVSEGSVITIRPGGIFPSGSESNSSVSTEYSATTPSRNSSTTSLGSLFSSQTGSLFDWSTVTLTEPQTSDTSLELPSITFPTPQFSIITTPMTPPGATTTPSCTNKPGLVWQRDCGAH
ncbi:hypothetical protein ACHAQK_001409 [Fusarium lateritium]